MRFSTLGALLITTALNLVSAQGQVSTISNQTSSLISNYGDSFKNAGGKVLNDKVNGRKQQTTMQFQSAYCIL